jgi:1,2-diacylglycerol 3-beta-galactosyltransferase
VARLAQPNVVRLFRQQQPDLIISVHPLVHEMSFRALKRLRKQPPFATVITDLASAHPLWFYPRVDLCFIPTEPVYRYALQLGMQEAQLRLLGLPVRPVFAQASQPKTVLRQQLGMHPDLPAVLVMGGGDGIGAVAEIARQVASKLTGREGALGQIVVIAGRNRALLEGLSAQRWPIPAKVQGFVENVDQWMNACDCIVTKSGPGTIAEASCCGLPMILSGFIPGQEAGNAPYVVEHGAGAYETEPPAIAALIQRWFSTERAKLGQMAAQARALGRPNATVEIVEVIAGLLPPAPISYS